MPLKVVLIERDSGQFELGFKHREDALFARGRFFDKDIELSAEPFQPPVKHELAYLD
jgi:hypothetical protein